MFLAKLSNEKRHLFLDLELHISKIDGEFSESEKNIIDTHCIEMHIDSNKYQCELSLDEVIRKLSECTVQEKHIIFIEMLAVVMADEVYHEKEKQIVEDLADVLGISNDEIIKAFSALNKLKEAYEELSNFVYGV